MNPSLFNTYVEIKNPVSASVDRYGDRTQTFTSSFAWARIDKNNHVQTVENNLYIADFDKPTITIRYRDNINEKSIVVMNDKKYDVLNVETLYQKQYLSVFLQRKTK